MKRAAHSLAAITLCGAAALASTTRAEESSCRNQAGSVAGVACEVTAALKASLETSGAELVVAAAPLQTDRALASQDALVKRVSALVAAGLGPKTRLSQDPLPLAVARAKTKSAAPLLFLTLRLSRQKLELSAELYPALPRFWARVKNPSTMVTSHASASRPLDAEVRSFLPPLSVAVKTIDRAAGLDRDIVALACGDAAGDGKSEIAAIGRYRISVGRVELGRFVAARAAIWNDVAKVAPAPFRDPIASAWISEPGHLEVGSSDRAQAVRLDAGLNKVADLGYGLPWPANGCAPLEGLGLGEPKARCPAAFVGFSAENGRFDAIAGARLVDAKGVAHGFSAMRQRADGSLILNDDAGHTLRASTVGAALALADLDADGNVELLSSVDTLDPAQDALVVSTWKQTPDLTERLRVPVPSGIKAIAVCPLEGDSMAPIAVATGDGLWLIR